MFNSVRPTPLCLMDERGVQLGSRVVLPVLNPGFQNMGLPMPEWFCWGAGSSVSVGILFADNFGQ